MSGLWYICKEKSAEVPETAVGYTDPAACVLDHPYRRDCVVAAVTAKLVLYYSYEGVRHDLSDIFLHSVVEKEDLASCLERRFRESRSQISMMHETIEGIIDAWDMAELPPTVKRPVRGFKALNKDMRPGWGPSGVSYEVGRQYDMGGLVAPCNRGYHFCEDLTRVFSFYEVGSRVFEVEASGRVVKAGMKSVASRIRLVREIVREELVERLKECPERMSLEERSRRNELLLLLQNIDNKETKDE